MVSPGMQRPPIQSSGAAGGHVVQSSHPVEVQRQDDRDGVQDKRGCYRPYSGMDSPSAYALTLALYCARDPPTAPGIRSRGSS